MHRILACLAHICRALPPNGLALYSGEGELVLLEPPAPLRRGAYVCGHSFAVEPMLDLCEQGTPVGVVVIDGAGCVIGFADGLRRVVLKRFAVSLTLTIESSALLHDRRPSMRR